MKNSLMDVHNILMEQLERINEAETTEEIETEIKKAKAIERVAKVIVDNSKTMFDATKLGVEYGVNFAGTILQVEVKK